MKFCNLVLPVLISSVSAFAPGYNNVRSAVPVLRSSVLETGETAPSVVIEESAGTVTAPAPAQEQQEDQVLMLEKEPIVEEKKDRIVA